jgi:hypothetical protein
MKLESLVITSYEAEILFNLGLKQVSCFYWYQDKVPNEPELFKKDITQFMMPWKLSIGKASNNNHEVFKEFSAYTSSELGEMLPNFLFTNNICYKLYYVFKGTKWEYTYHDVDRNESLSFITASTEQDARAMLLIQIIEKKYIDISQTIIK